MSQTAMTKADKKAKKNEVRDTIVVIIEALLIALVFRTFLYQPFSIPTASMQSTLMIGDYFVASKFTWGLGKYSFPIPVPMNGRLLQLSEPQRGDIAVFHNEPTSEDYIKRIIGLPGDQIELRRKRVYVNGQRLDEPYVYYLEPPDESGTDEASGASRDPRVSYGPVTVPSGHYFAMGDNRDNSEDSRYWGFLPRDYVKGRGLVIYWSYDAAAGDIVTSTRWDRLLRQVR